MNATISSRAIEILRVLAPSENLSRPAIAQAVGETRDNTIRELGRLIELGYVATSGTGRATTYAITDKARTLALWDVEEYLALEPDQRHARYRGSNQTCLKRRAASFVRLTSKTPQQAVMSSPGGARLTTPQQGGSWSGSSSS